VLYAIGKQGIASTSLQEPGTDLRVLFDLVVKHVPPPASDTEKPFKMLISSIEWNDYVGRIAIGRVEQGVIRQNMDIELISRDGDRKGSSRATKLFTFLGLKREPVEMAYAGDIIALAGYENVDIGDTICTTEDLNPIEYTNIDRPTLSMFFRVNDGPMVGREGKFVTSNLLKDRLQKEARNNISIRVEETADADVIKVSGRGELQLAILIETMRREGFEFCVSRPEVVLWEKDGIKYEPVEEVVVDVPSDYASKVIDKLQQRKGMMESMDQEGENTRLTFKVPSRGLLGFRSEVLTETRGTAMVHQQFHSYEPFKGEIAGRNRGAMIALEDGPVTAYALEGLQDRGIFFVEPGDVSYMGMIVGQNSRADDLIVNVAKAKHLTNHRASQTGAEVKIAVAKKLTLEQAIEFLDKEELLEVTPQSLRLRKRWLDHNERKRMEKQ
jgi:GTP-binding protein